MFLPSGYHIDASVSGEKDAPSTIGAVPYLFPAGIGSALMNGCWGTGYKPGDPCYTAKWKSDVCQVNILNYVFTIQIILHYTGCKLEGSHMYLRYLSWKYDIDDIATKISITVGLTVKLHYFIPRGILLKVYQ